MRCRIFILQKHLADYRWVQNNGGYLIVGRNAYSYNLKHAFRDREGKNPTITVYHANNPIPFSGDISPTSVDTMFRNVDLLKTGGGLKISAKFYVLMGILLVFLFYYFGAIL